MCEKKKLKEAVKLRSLYILLTKERGFGFQRTINYGEMTSMYLEIINGKKRVILVKSVFVNSFLYRLVIYNDESFFSP